MNAPANDPVNAKHALQSRLAALVDAENRVLPEDLAPLWRTPRLGVADVNHPLARALTDGTGGLPEPVAPETVLAGANRVVAFFVPFTRAVADDNRAAAPAASAKWARAYLTTNAAAARWVEELVRVVVSHGGRAAAVGDAAAFDTTAIRSRWSHRHWARMAGLGSFGRNNLLISEDGCCGRYFTFVVDWPALEPDAPRVEEDCLYRLRGVCGVCAARCPTKALRPDAFDRAACFAQCRTNEASFPGAEVCGQCVVGLPCSFTRPAAPSPSRDIGIEARHP